MIFINYKHFKEILIVYTILPPLISQDYIVKKKKEK